MDGTMQSRQHGMLPAFLFISPNQVLKLLRPQHRMLQHIIQGSILYRCDIDKARYLHSRKYHVPPRALNAACWSPTQFHVSMTRGNVHNVSIFPQSGYKSAAAPV